MEQKSDLAKWVVLRERMNCIVRKPEVLSAMLKMILYNKSIVWPEDLDDEDVWSKKVDMYSGKYNLEHRYRTWLEWTSVNADCGKLRIVGKKTAAPRTHADSEALTEQNAADTYRKFKARLVALGIGQWVSGESN